MAIKSDRWIRKLALQFATPLPARIYADEGLAEVQNQTGLTLPKL